MSKTVFSVLTEIQGQIAALGSSVAPSPVQDQILSRLTAIEAQLATLTEAAEEGFRDASQLALNLANKIGTPPAE